MFVKYWTQLFGVVVYAGRKIAFITGRTYRKGNIANGDGVFPFAIHAVDFVDVRVFAPANVAVHKMNFSFGCKNLTAIAITHCKTFYIAASSVSLRDSCNWCRAR